MKRLRILHLEDDPDYSDLVRVLLEKEAITADLILAGDRASFEAALALEPFDLILADYLLPSYNGLQALHVAREKCPQTPFLLVSGTIGEQAAIESLKNGATDYVLKHWPERLVPAIRRAVEEAEERLRRKQVETELVRRERYFCALTENALDIHSILSRDGLFVYNSPSVRRVLGYEPKTLSGQSAFALVHPEDLPRVLSKFEEGVQHPEKTITLQFRFQHRNGSWVHLEAVGQNRIEDPEIAGVIINSRDITDRRRAEDELRESDAQYRLIFDGNRTPMWVFDRETLRFLEVNDAAEKHYGYSREEFLAMTVAGVRPEEEAPQVIEYIHQLLSESGPSKMGMAGTFRHRKKDGTVLDAEIRWSPINFKGRAATLVMASDVTQRKRQEHRDAALSKLGQSLSSATSPVEAAGIIRAVADDLFPWDAFTLDLYSVETEVITPVLNVDTDHQGRRFEVATAGVTKKPSGMASRVIAQGAELILRQEPIQMPPDSTPIGETSRPSASLMLAPVRNRTKVIGVLSIQSYTKDAYAQSDLSALQTLADHCGGALERIRAEQALHESEQRFRDLFEGSPDAIFVEDTQGIVLDVNPQACRLHGLSREELIRKSVAELVPAEIRGQVEQDFKSLVAGTLQQVESVSWTADGRAVPVEVRASRVVYAGNPAVLLHVRDITERRHLEDQLRQSQKMEAIGQLAGGVAHDFNNILTVIHGHASLLLSGGQLGPAPARSAQQIAQAAERAAGLTRQLLAFSRRQVIKPQRLDMNEVVCNMTRMLGRILGEDISLQLNYSPQTPAVLADASMIEQVLLNLAVNSRDAMPQGGQLAININVVQLQPAHLVQRPEARSGRFVCLSVTDSGCGIASEHLGHIFEPFFTTKGIGKGTGLGLATVYGIVKQHQGWIEVESRAGNGTLFSVYLPCTDEPALSAEVLSRRLQIQGGNETILVIEDETPVRELVCSFLQGYGYKVLEAESGPKALEVWRDHRDRVDLVLTDLVMPDRMNGRELAEKLWAERPQLKVIFTSGYSADVVGKDFVLERGYNYLQKPYDPNQLAATVRDCLDTRN